MARKKKIQPVMPAVNDLITCYCDVARATMLPQLVWWHPVEGWHMSRADYTPHIPERPGMQMVVTVLP